MATDHNPPIDEAVPSEEPAIQNDLVRRTLDKLGPYNYDPATNLKFKDCAFLGPYVIK